MALHGKFYLNKKEFTALEFPGIGTFKAFSGNRAFKNQPGCTHTTPGGAIPAGKYWIVPRPLGGFKTQAKNAVMDFLPRNDHSRWLALYRDDGTIDDYTFINGVRRGNFRLHPKGFYGLSEGCITLDSGTDYHQLWMALINTPRMPIPGTTLTAYGTIEVYGYERKCPFTESKPR